MKSELKKLYLQFVPHLEKTLNKMQTRVENHVSDFATTVLKELGLRDVVAQSVMKKIEDLFEKVEEQGHNLVRIDFLYQQKLIAFIVIFVRILIILTLIKI